ncbi:MAG: hypothetical protein JWO86_4286 [Myxococcaceae bacterium]|nr:hypothetical protein [Myxococcaceae bacterium]MEA2746898.1 hypothetical protein [Myxococcales bacterium]
MEPSRARNVIAIGVAVAAAGIAYAIWERRVYVADVRTICSAEGPAETTIVKSRTLVEGVARKAVRGEKGLALANALKSAPPDSAATKLRDAAEEVKIAPCPAVASYEALSTRLVLQKNVERMCTGMNPTMLARLPRAARFERLQEWTHTNVTEPAVDELLTTVSTAGTSPQDRTARLRSAISDLDIHECGVLSGLASPLDPTPGANVRIQSVAVQSDPRESAVVDDLRAKLPAYRECYDKGLEKDAALGGTVVVKFRLTETGAIDFALAQEDTSLASPTVVTCLLDAIKTAHGPAGPHKSPGGISLVFWVAK